MKKQYRAASRMNAVYQSERRVAEKECAVAQQRAEAFKQKDQSVQQARSAANEAEAESAKALFDARGLQRTAEKLAAR